MSILNAQGVSTPKHLNIDILETKEMVLLYSPREVTWQGGAIVMVQCIMK